MKKLAVLLLAACLALGGTGCGKGVSETVSGLVEDAGTALQADGREYGQTYTFGSGELVKTAFFNFQVNEVSTAAEIEGYAPDDEANQFLIVNVTIENTFEDDSSISMFDTDFQLIWTDLGDTGIYPDLEFAEGQLPEEYQLLKGDSRTGDLIFIVPADVTEFQLKYLEVWSDDFEGNTYLVDIKL